MGKPTEPAHLQVAPGDGKATLLWQPPEDNGGADITKYQVSLDNSGVWDDAYGVSSYNAHDFPNLTAGKAYTYHVRAVNLAGAGLAASITQTAVANPKLTCSVGAVTSSSAVLTGVITNRGGADITERGFWIRMATSANYSYYPVSAASDTFSMTIPNLQPEIYYRALAYAKNSVLTPAAGASPETEPFKTGTPVSNIQLGVDWSSGSDQGKIAVNEVKPVTAKITPPGATNQNLNWSIGNNSPMKLGFVGSPVLTGNGTQQQNIVGVCGGTVTVTAAAQDGSGKSGAVTVQVVSTTNGGGNTNGCMGTAVAPYTANLTGVTYVTAANPWGGSDAYNSHFLAQRYGITAIQLDGYIKSLIGSPIPGVNDGATFLKYQAESGIDVRILVGMAVGESSLGTSGIGDMSKYPHSNMFGYGATDSNPENGKKYNNDQAVMYIRSLYIDSRKEYTIATFDQKALTNTPYVYYTDTTPAYAPFAPGVTATTSTETGNIRAWTATELNDYIDQHGGTPAAPAGYPTL